MKNRERGSVFIIALAVLSGLVAVMAVVAAGQRAEVRAQINRSEDMRSRIAAESAIQRAMAELALIQPGQPTLTTDGWAELGGVGSQRFTVGNLSFRMEILDATSRLNLNTVTQPQLERLPLTPEQIESLLDWREGGRDPRAQGAKDEYYNNLPEPYNTKLRRFDTVNELLLVKGFTPDTLFNPQTEFVNTLNPLTGPAEEQPALYDLFVVDSYSANVNAAGQTKLNVNAGSANVNALMQRLQVSQPVAAAIIAGRPYARLGDVLARPGVTQANYRAILDNLMVGGGTRAEGKLNLNTVTESVLLSIPEVTQDVAQAIVQRQSNGGFESLGDLLTVPGMNSLNILRTTADLFTTNSQSFLVRAIGTAGGMSTAIEANIVIENNQPRILKVRDYPLDDPILRWNWEDEPQFDVVLQGGGA